MNHDALILVDIQNDFLPGGSFAVPDGGAVVTVANRLVHRFELIVATQDWHPPDHGSFAANHPGRTVGERVDLDGVEQVLWPVHCVQGTHGAALASELEGADRLQRVYKGRPPNIDSYSGFFDNDHRQPTQLDGLLRRGRVDRVYIMGLATDYCVKATALDAAQLGYDTCVIVDGCRGVGLRPSDIDDAILEMIAAGVGIIDSHSLLRRAERRDSDSDTHGLDEQTAGDQESVLRSTAHLQFVRRGNWSFVRRNTATAVVAVLAVTPENELLLVEQFRPPVNARVIELPAGLVGDTAGAENETLEQSAERELLEETGYHARDYRHVFTGTSSAGLTDEMTGFVVATNLRRVHEGGGVENENIRVHRVPLAQIDQWLKQKCAEGCLVDARVPSGLYLMKRK